MTAEEFLQKKQIDNRTIYNYEGEDVGYTSDIMIEFAQYHVKEALQEALDVSPYGSSTDIVTYEDCVHILDCYPLENIK